MDEAMKSRIELFLQQNGLSLDTIPSSRKRQLEEIDRAVQEMLREHEQAEELQRVFNEMTKELRFD